MAQNNAERPSIDNSIDILEAVEGEVIRSICPQTDTKRGSYGFLIKSFLLITLLILLLCREYLFIDIKAPLADEIINLIANITINKTEQG